MAYLSAKDRFQTRITSLEEAINKDNPVRFIADLEDSLDLTASTSKIAA